MPDFKSVGEVDEANGDDEMGLSQEERIIQG